MPTLVFYRLLSLPYNYCFLSIVIVSYCLPLFFIVIIVSLWLLLLFIFQYGDAGSSNLGGGGAMGVSGLGSCNRLRYDHHLTSELEGDKMVLKITKPPRNKDSFSSLTGQTLSWLMKVCFSNWTVLSMLYLNCLF